MKQRKVEIIKKWAAHEGFFRLDKYRLRHSLFRGGMSREMSRELFERGHAVAMLPYDPVRDELILLEQFRIGAIHDPDTPWLTEIVAGMIGEGECATEVVRREAMEEAGCEVGELIPISRYYVSPGGTSETIELYCGIVDVERVTAGIYGLDEENEDICVFKVAFHEAVAWLDSGRINSAAPIIALQWLMINRDRLRQRHQSQ